MAKSTINKKLARMGKPVFCTSAGKNMCKKIFTKEGGAYTISFCFKQTSKTNPFQIQYRYKHRYTAAKEKEKGAKYTGYTSWKNAIDMSGIAYGSTKSADEWLKANRGVVKSGTYNRFMTRSSKSIGADYDAQYWQFRVRTYNAKTKKHGEWVVSDTLCIYKAAKIVDETMHRTPSGGIMFDLNYIWDKGGSIHVDSIKDSDGRQLLRNKITRALSKDSNRTASSKPSLRSGYVPGEFEVKVGELKRAVEYGETLDVTAYFQTKDGAKTYISCSKVSSEDTSINAPRKEVTKYVGAGTYYVFLYKTDADDVIEFASASCTYTYNSKKYTIKPYYTKLNLGVKSTTEPIAEFRFRPPFGLECTFKATVSNDYKSSRTISFTDSISYNHFVFNSLEGDTCYASLAGNAKLSMTTQRTAEIGLPFGREMPVAFFGKGASNEITLSGFIYERNTFDTYKYGKYEWWNKLRSQQGLFCLRCPNGEMYNVAITKVDISSEREGLREVTVTMMEVDV